MPVARIRRKTSSCPRLVEPGARDELRRLIGKEDLINGAAGVVSIRNGQPFSVVVLTVRGGKIVEIDILADPERTGRLDLTLLDR
jgi:hypothetical protein